jgi:aromatic-L-amino-acid decarboxylase
LFPAAEPAAIDALFAEPIPERPTRLGPLLQQLEQQLLPHCTHVNHPGYFGLITPPPTPAGILGDLWASALNQNLGVWSIGPGAVAMERRVVRWLDDLVGYGVEAGGNLTSGGMMANFIALKLARDWATRDRAQQVGVRTAMAVYTSEERHISVDKAVDAVGLGREQLRVLPTDECFRLRMDALEDALARDARQGIQPACIVAMGGSTNTGAVDDLPALRGVADRVGAWLHVDAAYGGGMLLSRLSPGLLRGISAADSVTLDPHKWFFAPLDAGAVLVRDAQRLTRSFGMRPSYLVDPLDPQGERYNYYEHGFEQSRRFRALKVWLGFKRYGTDQLAAWIDANLRHAQRLYALAASHPDFVPAMPPPMSAVCLRYQRPGTPAERLTRLHAEVTRAIERSGRFWIGTTVMKGQTWFRVNPVNFRTRTEHVESLFEALASACAAAR